MESGNEIALIRWKTYSDESITLVDGRTFPSLEEAAGAFAVDMRKVCGVEKRYSLDRAHVMSDLNVGVIFPAKEGGLNYRTIWAHRLGDEALAVPHMRVKDSNGRPGTVLAGQFVATSSGPQPPEGPGWVGGKNGWLAVEWDDGIREDTDRYPRTDRVKAANLAALERSRT